ncbi:MAG: lyase family protein [Pikeienuella sp.]|uniref:lyase family protein n=1 Tax=Pikeienuella sp. TaxID=2831957 RepID=UPI00391CB1CE
MAVTPFDSALWRDLYGDAEIGALFSDAAELRALMLAEAALARVQARLGLVPETAAAAITRAATEASLDPASLSRGVAEAGVSVPAFVDAFRATLPPDAGIWLHLGATSQDMLDTGLVLRLRRALEILEGRLASLVATLAEKAAAEAETVMAARTRGQIATPTTLGAKIAIWRAPLLRAGARIGEAKGRSLRASLAGASGTLAAFGPKGPEIAAAFAAELGLAHDPVPWHATRDGIAEIGAALTLMTGALGKIGLDARELMQTEVAEIAAGPGGGSSTMPHKANPVWAEALVALAKANAGIVGRLFEAQLHAQEREGAAWALEWLTLPQIVVASGAALRHAQVLAAALESRPAAMARTLRVAGDFPLAEAATFALAPHIGRPEAQALVKAACARAAAEGRPLRDILAETSDAPVDWAATLDPAAYLGAAPEIARR